ncbi:sugar ABC transporter substrate-binding protein [Actinoplanes sp. NBRC 14428]|uniref:Carbohydrate ABC transporter substrate-binding protein (CUT1 family) n=1 Tax=Pseudosporangium ferrugineum TaxID=439699 RepID=A0A2T0SIS0_9ACTN|nr:ABC transporter substrate-binding protein [Pseudosporangium ferrugineum]PRY33304.1 carbohydrate ABC transporter substrate-binding protein (CUT1 family) [Pseudosporangium ferrugineum]BCJ48698.1 sugar ABC transporter substrate-binding protein [Actinoplanes sp. NBRC 14428]
MIQRRTGAARRPSRWAAAIGVAALLSPLTACSSGPGGTVVNLYGGASGTGFDKILKDCNDRAGGRYTIVGNLLPSDADGQRDQFVRRLAAKDDGMDLLGMDVTWTAEFAEAKWIRELTGEQKAQATKDTLQPPIDTATWKDKLYGVPRTTNVQLLWYRKSLVPTPPKTFDEMITMAQRLKAEGKPYEIGLTAAQYEGYVVNVNNLITAAGGTLVNEDSSAPTIDDKTVQALTLLKKLATSGVTSASLSNAQEPEVFADLQAGRSAFSLNWPYVLSAMREANPDLVNDLGYAPYPSIDGGPPKVTLGGMNYAISSYSKHPAEAFEAAMCLRDEKNALSAALDAGDVPALATVFETPEFQKAYPMADVMKAELQAAVPRPVSPVYQNISTIVSTTLSPPQSINPQAAADELRDSIKDAIEGKGIVP